MVKGGAATATETISQNAPPATFPIGSFNAITCPPSGGASLSESQQSWRKSNYMLRKNQQVRVSSREKLPGISLHQKLQMFTQRCENQIYAKVSKLDKPTLQNVQHVSEFCSEIHDNMLRSEKKWDSDPTYMAMQIKIDESIRSTMIDWLIKIHYNFKLLPETLFLTVNVIDRYFSLY
jgi:hypothetical protein